MKQCPRCRQVYTDDLQNFCLNDGELLVSYSEEGYRPAVVEDSPPTLVMDPARVTNPIGWDAGQPIDRYSPPPPSAYTNSTFGTPVYQQQKDQTLPTVSLVLGIGSVLLVCCYAGIWLGLPAAIVGYMGMRNTDRDPGIFGGRGLAITGMVLGIVMFLANILILLATVFGR